MSLKMKNGISSRSRLTEIPVWKEGVLIVLIGAITPHSTYVCCLACSAKMVLRVFLRKVFQPAVLKRMEQSEWDWWGNTDQARDRIIQVLQRTPAAESGRGREGERKAPKRGFSRWQQPEPETKNP